jgi:L-ascorbate metabolism protein UlaG (beta-lactamase superfamily)
MHDQNHFDGTRFFNPTGANGQPVRAVPRMLRERRTPWPDQVPVSLQRPAARGDASAVVTFIGHATFLIQTPEGNLITDPVYSDRASPLQFLGPRRVRRPAVAFDDLPPIHVILLSHNHYDHCDGATLRAIDARWRPLVLTPLNNGRLLKSFGMRRIEELDWWDHSAQAPMPVALTPAQHFSARTPFDRNRALWGGFTVTTGKRRLFFAGDTGYGPHFSHVRDRIGTIDLALLPIGAYEPRWFMKDIHMNPEEAVKAHVDLGALQSLGMHFGTFQLTLEGIADPIAALEDALRRRNGTARMFRAPDFGESITLD